MDILLITQHYHPEPNMITQDLATHLAGKGHKVVVLTAHPNYPLGRFYDSVRSLKPQKSIENGVTVWRLPMIPDHSLSKVKRILSYLSFTFIAALFAPFVLTRPHCVIVYQTPFTTVAAALWHKFVSKAKLVFVVPDLWPESFVAAGVMREDIIMKAMYQYVRQITRFADHIVCTTRGMLEVYRDRGVPESKLSLIYLWVDGSKLFETSRPNPSFPEQPRLIYAGNLGRSQGVDTILEACRILKEEGVTFFLDIYGTGTELDSLKAGAEKANLDTVRFMGRIEPKQLVSELHNCRGQLIHLIPSSLFRMTIPSKLLFAFSSGIPAIAALEGESAEIAEKSGGMLVCRPSNPKSLALAMKQLIQCKETTWREMQKRTLEFYKANFRVSRALAEYEDIVRSIAAKKKDLT